MTVSIDRDRAALIIQDMQNDAISEGGAFADSGAPQHAAAWHNASISYALPNVSTVTSCDAIVAAIAG